MFNQFYYIFEIESTVVIKIFFYVSTCPINFLFSLNFPLSLIDNYWKRLFVSPYQLLDGTYRIPFGVHLSVSLLDFDTTGYVIGVHR